MIGLGGGLEQENSIMISDKNRCIIQKVPNKFVQLMKFKIFNHDFLVKKNIFIFSAVIFENKKK